MAKVNERGIEQKEESRECPEHGEIEFWYRAEEHCKCGVPSKMFFGAVEGVCGRKCKYICD